jgi:hypothetical protein
MNKKNFIFFLVTLFYFCVLLVGLDFSYFFFFKKEINIKLLSFIDGGYLITCFIFLFLSIKQFLKGVKQK